MSYEPREKQNASMKIWEHFVFDETAKVGRLLCCEKFNETLMLGYKKYDVETKTMDFKFAQNVSLPFAQGKTALRTVIIAYKDYGREHSISRKDSVGVTTEVGLRFTKDKDLAFVFNKSGGDAPVKDFYIVIPCDESCKGDEELTKAYYNAVLSGLLASLDDTDTSSFKAEFLRKRYGKDGKNTSGNSAPVDDKMAKEGDDDFPF